jgi:peptidoglycan hydrolase-like protein with peptidoglycan-binding domain
MKRIIPFALATVLALGFAAAGLAQQSAKNAQKKPPTAPASTGYKTTMEQKSTMMANEALQLNKDEIMALQNALIKANAYKGKANGMLDAATKTAIRKYQTDHKLKVTGEPNQETLHKLGVAHAAPTTKPAAQSMGHSTDVKKEAGKKPQAESKKPQ